MALCPKCRKSFRVPEGEEGEHDCPRCGDVYGREEVCPICKGTGELDFSDVWGDRDIRVCECKQFNRRMGNDTGNGSLQ